MDEYSNIRRCGNLELEGKGRIDKFGQEVSIGYCSILQSVVRVFRDSVDAKEDSNTNRWGLVGNGGEEDNLKVWQVWNFQKDNFLHRSAWREGDNNVGENKSFFPGK